MLKTEMIDKLNAQMNLELFSSLLYQQMSAWCSYQCQLLWKVRLRFCVAMRRKS